MDICKWLLLETEKGGAGLGSKHLKPNSAELSKPSDLALFAGHPELADYLRDFEKATDDSL